MKEFFAKFGKKIQRLSRLLGLFVLISETDKHFSLANVMANVKKRSLKKQYLIKCYN